MKSLFKMGGFGDSEPPYPEAAEAKTKWKSSISDLQTLIKLLSKVSDRVDKVAEAWAALADHLGAMGSRAEKGHSSILLALSEGERSTAASLWQFYSLLEDEMLPELTKAAEMKHPDLEQAKDGHKKSRKELTKARKEKVEDEEAAANKIQALGNAVAETGSNLAQISNRLRNDKYTTVSQTLYTSLRNQIAITRAVVEGLESAKPGLQKAASDMCLEEPPVRGSIGEISAPFDVQHIAGGGGGSRLTDTTNIDLRKSTVKPSLEQAFPSRRFDGELQGDTEGKGDNSDDETSASCRASSSTRPDSSPPPLPPLPRNPPPQLPNSDSPPPQEETGAPPGRPPPRMPPPLPARPNDVANPPAAAPRAASPPAASTGLATLLPGGAAASSASNSSVSGWIVRSQQAEDNNEWSSDEDESDSRQPSGSNAEASGGASSGRGLHDSSPGWNPAQQEDEEGWAAYRDDEGRIYFHHSGTGITQWERPEGFDGQPEEDDD